MDKYESDDSFLGRWIDGTLSEEERIAFEQSDAYKTYAIINREAQLLEGPTIDTEGALAKVQKQLHQDSDSKTKVRPLWYYVAAAAAVFIGFGLFLTSSVTYTTGIGETQKVTLADGSVIELNANSSVSHDRFFWENDKQVHLEGEAYFTITKGKGFAVHTTKGTVQVLGTQFNIKDRTQFTLACYEGRVSFDTNKNTDTAHILTAGMALNVTNEKVAPFTFEAKSPEWKLGISSFNNRPLGEVIEELTQYFPVEFNSENIDLNREFSGAFKHDDLNLALQSTLIPMGVKYEYNKAQNIVILSE